MYKFFYFDFKWEKEYNPSIFLSPGIFILGKLFLENKLLFADSWKINRRDFYKIIRILRPSHKIIE